MKPKETEIPFEWDDRKIMIHDRVWYIPGILKSEQQFVFPGWSDRSLFGNNNPIAIEYCSGNGAWIASKAHSFPHINWVAVEMKYKRARKVWARVKNASLPNLVVVCAEAMRATREFFPPCSISTIHINFPDPWPKSKHAKKRLIRAEFLEQMDRILQKEGVISFVTDDPTYSDWTIETFSKDPRFAPVYPAPYYTLEMADYGTSFFEEMWRQQGKTIRYHQFIKAL